MGKNGRKGANQSLSVSMFIKVHPDSQFLFLRFIFPAVNHDAYILSGKNSRDSQDRSFKLHIIVPVTVKYWALLSASS